jgi:signal peptidase I
MGKRTADQIKEYLKSIAIAVLIALFVRTFVVQAFHIPSGSMKPTLLVGDYILVNKMIFGIRVPYSKTRLLEWRKPKLGDVVVFLYPLDPSKDFVKRVIATEDQKVQLINSKIYINDKLIPDPWGYFKKEGPPGFVHAVENYGPVVVPKDALFVMGDNRNNSDDSRFWGFVPLGNVVGKAFIIYFSWDANATNLWDKVRWSRIGKLIH